MLNCQFFRLEIICTRSLLVCANEVTFVTFHMVADNAIISF